MSINENIEVLIKKLFSYSLGGESITNEEADVLYKTIRDYQFEIANKDNDIELLEYENDFLKSKMSFNAYRLAKEGE